MTATETLLGLRPCNSHIDLSATHYVIIRSDLPIGFLAAQVVHAAGESSPGNIEPGTNAVVLAVESEAHLMMLEVQLRSRGIGFVAIREPDAPYNGQLTAIGLVPLTDRAKVKPVLGRLPLLGAQMKLGAAV